jgi:acetolactate synthase I/II/III large subunit
MTRMTGGDSIADSRLRCGVDTVFGLTDMQMYGLLDAVAHNSNRLKVINARHEQTTVSAAPGYLRHRQGLSTLRVPPTQTAIGEKGQVA